VGQANLYGKSLGKFNIDGLIKDYYVYAGESISAGDFVEFINGVASQTNYGTSSTTQMSSLKYSTSGHHVTAHSLGSGKVFISYAGSSDGTNHLKLYGIVVTISGKTITKGTETQLYSSDLSWYVSSCLLLDGKIFIVYEEEGGKLKGTVCTISGTTITAGESYLIASSSTYILSTTVLPDGKVFISYPTSSSKCNLVVCSVSGTTITVGTSVSITTSVNSSSVVSLKNGKVFVAFCNSGLNGMVCTVSGTTITTGTITQLDTSSTSSGQYSSVVLASDGKVFITYSTSEELRGIVCIVNNTTITKGTSIKLTSAYVTGGRFDTIVLSNDKVYILHSWRDPAYSSKTGFVYGVVATVSGITITAGTDTALNTSYTYMNSYFENVLLPNGTIFSIYCSGTNSSLKNYPLGQVFGISNNAPTKTIIATNYETQVRKTTTSQFEAVAKTKGLGGTSTGHKDKISVCEGPNYYIQSTGTQYIDTGFMPNQHTKIKIEFSGNLQTGIRTSGNLDEFRISCDETNSLIDFAYGTSYTRIENVDLSKRHIVEYDGRGSFYLDGELKIQATGTISVWRNYFIFKLNQAGIAYAGTSPAKIYNYKIYDNDVLVRDYIPAIDTNGVVCLYDRVTQTYFYNQGTGSFTASLGKMIELDYIESTGTQYIDTEIVPNSKTKIKVDYQLTNNNSNGTSVGIVGAYEYIESTGISNGMLLGANSNNFQFAYGWGFNGKSKAVDTNRHTAIINDNGICTFDGETLVTLEDVKGSLDVNKSIFLGWSNGGTNQKAIMRLYSCEIWEDEELIRDYIPVIDPNGTVCLYDKVSQTYFYNKGTGEFLTN